MKTQISRAPTMDQAMSFLCDAHGSQSPVFKRILAVNHSQGELFDAAEAVMKWLSTVRFGDLHINRVNRLTDALNKVREAHQMEPDDVLR